MGDKNLLYRLKLVLDGDEAAASLGLKMENVKQKVREMATATGQANGKVEQLVNSFEAAPRSMQPLSREINQADESLEELAASATRSWGNVEQGALEAAEGADRMGAALVRNSERAEESMKDLAATQARVRGTTFSLGSTASSTASQLSIDLTQSAQDAAFGLENLAASAPFLQEQFGRLRRESSSFVGALSSLGSAFMGPTGVIAAFTLVLTFKDELVSLFQSIIQGATGASSAIEKFGNTLDEEIRSFEDSEELVSLFSNLEQGTESYTEVQGILQEALNQNVNAIDEFKTAITSAISGIDSYDKAVEKLDRHQLDRIVRSGFREVASINNFPEFQQRLQELQTAQEGLADAMNAMNIESLEQMTLTNRLQENYPLTRKEAKNMAQILLEEKEAREEANEEAEKAVEYMKRLRNLRVERMEEGISKEINAINTSIMARREEIKELDLEAEKQQKLLDLLQQVEEQKKSAALEDFSTVDLELQEGEGIQDAISRINSNIDERIRKVRNLKGEYSDLSEQQQEQAIEELEGEREEETADVRERAMFVNGRLVRRDEFIENTKENFNMAQQRIQSELEALRFEKESGVRVGGIFGDSMFGGAAGAAADRENLKKRFEKRRELIEEEQEKAGRMLQATGEDKYAQKWADLEKKRTRLTKKEAEKRLQINLQTMREIGTAIDSSPIGNATSNLITDLGALWQAHYENQINWAEKNNKEKAAMITSVGSQVVGAASKIASATFRSWKEERKQDLKEEGKTAKERRKILKKEGKKRFKTMKAIKITEASVNTAAGVTRALAELPPPASYAAAAATAAAGLFRIKQIAGMSIGDRIGGGGQGGGARGGQFTQRAAASSATAAGRVGTAMEAQRKNDEDTINRTAKKVGEEVGKQMPDRVTMDDDTAEQANDAAVNQKNKLNK